MSPPVTSQLEGNISSLNKPEKASWILGLRNGEHTDRRTQAQRGDYRDPPGLKIMMKILRSWVDVKLG